MHYTAHFHAAVCDDYQLLTGLRMKYLNAATNLEHHLQETTHAGIHTRQPSTATPSSNRPQPPTPHRILPLSPLSNPNIKLPPHKLPNLPRQPQPPDRIPPYPPRHPLLQPQHQPHLVRAINVPRRLRRHRQIPLAGISPDVTEHVFNGLLERAVRGLQAQPGSVVVQAEEELRLRDFVEVGVRGEVAGFIIEQISQSVSIKRN